MYNIDLRIWEILKEYDNKLSFHEREGIACKLDNLFEEVKKSTPDLDRLAKIESDIQGLQELSIASANRMTMLKDQLADLDETVISHDKIIDSIKDLEYKITQLYVKQQGKISEIDAGYSKLDNRLENLTSTVEKMADVLINQATETINELTYKRISEEYE